MHGEIETALNVRVRIAALLSRMRRCWPAVMQAWQNPSEMAATVAAIAPAQMAALLFITRRGAAGELEVLLGAIAACAAGAYAR